MSLSNDDDPVRTQYEQWIFPEPIPDLTAPGLLRDSGDPYFLGPSYWPTDPNKQDLHILVAGCGANAAARYSINNPKAKVVGIDISERSLAHSSYLKSKHSLDNLFLQRSRVEDIEKLEQTFDLIDCSGVLHHVAEPQLALRSLAKVLRSDGVIFLMLYGKYGRTGVYMLQKLFRLLNLDQTAQGVRIVRQAIPAIGANHPAKPYVATAPDIGFEGGLVDTFLHRRDRAYTVGDCLELLEKAGLVLQGWKDSILYYPEGMIRQGEPLFEAINALPESEKWQAMELLNGSISQHCLYACLSSRKPASYRISFEGEEFMNWIPTMRRDFQYEMQQGILHMRHSGYPQLAIGNPRAAVLVQVDGKKSIEECFKNAGLESSSRVDAVTFCRKLFLDLWRLGYYHYVLRPT